VAAHTWGVLALLHELWPEDFPRVAATVLYHDVPEAWIGDIPAPTKRYDQSVKEACDSLEKKILSRLDLPCDQDLSAEDAVKVKCCDHLELYLWAREQVYEGNGHAACVIRELDRFFEECPPPEPGLSLLREIRYGSIEHHTDRLIRDLCAEESEECQTT
jgi:5'-deoxynucleotidase YfbR-like HD superfamily hydrolase